MRLISAAPGGRRELPFERDGVRDGAHDRLERWVASASAKVSDVGVHGADPLRQHGQQWARQQYGYTAEMVRQYISGYLVIWLLSSISDNRPINN